MCPDATYFAHDHIWLPTTVIYEQNNNVLLSYTYWNCEQRNALMLFFSKISGIYMSANFRYFTFFSENKLPRPEFL